MKGGTGLPNRPDRPKRIDPEEHTGSRVEIADIASISRAFHEIGDPICRLGHTNPSLPKDTCGECLLNAPNFGPLNRDKIGTVEAATIIAFDGNRKAHLCRVCGSFEFTEVRE